MWQKDNIGVFRLNLKESKCGNRIKCEKVDNHRPIFATNIKKDFQNCLLRIIFIRFSPWINNNSSGIFIQILNTFAEVNGFRLQYLPENPIYAEELSASYSFDSAYEDLESGYADVFLGLGNNLPFTLFDTTITVYDDNLYWAVPKAKKIAYWKAVVKYLSIPYLLILMVFYWFTSLLYCFLAYKYENNYNFQSFIKAIFNIFALTLSLPMTILPKIWFYAPL